MELLFDILGPEHRHPDLAGAVRQLAENDETERGAVFTRPEVVTAILDLAGYTSDRPLHQLRLLEPAFGGGDFLLPAIDRLLQAYEVTGAASRTAIHDLAPAIRAVELHRASFDRTSRRVEERLRNWGLSSDATAALSDSWLIHDDFLLAHLEDSFDFVVGNPPYVRQERVPDALLTEYRRRFSTIYDRADLYVPFFERGLDLLVEGGLLGFICANRWMKNRYGGPLREKIARNFQLAHFIDMDGVDAFHSEVIAYPAITVIRRPKTNKCARPTRLATARGLKADELPKLAEEMLRGIVRPDSRFVEVSTLTDGRKPWLTGNLEELPVLRRLEARFPLLESTGTKVGIGVATGVDRVFIGPFDELPVEESRKLPLVMAGDLKLGRIEWCGKGVVNPFNPDGSLARLDDYPLFREYIEAHKTEIQRRHVARKNPSAWYRTIDRIYPELCTIPKLLIPDIKGTATVVYDEGHFYPHHNLYYLSSSSWDLRALQTILRSSIAILFVASYCTRMAGGFLRFQAQYLRRIRVPRWADVPASLRARLREIAEVRDAATVDAAVFEVYGLSEREAEIVSAMSARVQIVPKCEQEKP